MMACKISDLILLLEEIKSISGDVEIQAMHHEGGNSLRAYPAEIGWDSFVFNDGEDGPLIIGGWFN